ncbi:unannotated protein [freshwater metagenome]|uniref:Unannotated protein n=1 Tax=freshwater metagenome TaxID=449393 RepID=A0A6J7EHE1_9ZZZZ
MDRTMHAPHTAGVAAVTRAGAQQMLGYRWQPAAASCTTHAGAHVGSVLIGSTMNGFATNATSKRCPRRLGKRST